ncbi:sugar phosphate isomerase/epimerase family protein [Halorubrum aethiopicum]|uniref:sugar phosphate isomerase/epimerase family protein n=1 Tax=Halorubrum aethiopicum TaxID=1758255 RepID=UPI0009B5C7B1|nr:sugar phosphate isomerase/epimerase family protein [Halorubrum aethiopicum]
MQVDVGVASYPDLSLSELFQQSKNLNVDFIEIVMEGEYHRAKLANRVSECDRLMGDEISLIVHLPFGGLDVGSPFHHVRSGAVQELKKNIELASDLGAEKAVFHADTFVHPEIWDKETILDSLCESVQELDSFARRHDVELGIENVPSPFITVGDFPLLFDETTINATLDTGHSRVNQISHETVSRLLETHGDRFTHFHLNDTRGASDDHLPVGMGTTDFASLFRSLPNEWNGSMTVEAITTDFEYMAAGVERLREILQAI